MESIWEVVNKETKVVSTVLSQFFGEDYVDVVINEDDEEKTVRFANENKAGNLFNESYAVRLAADKATVNRNGFVDDNGETTLS